MKLIKNLLVALVLFTAAGRLDASSVIEVSFDELSRASDTVISGEVVSIVADRDPNGYIYSTVTIRVTEAVPQELIGTDYAFRMVGGELNDERHLHSGYAAVFRGRWACAFLDREPRQPSRSDRGVMAGRISRRDEFNRRFDDD